jgi:endonuclease/exonuclease/phosphatase family metal-dependent hydrolase
VLLALVACRTDRAGTPPPVGSITAVSFNVGGQHTILDPSAGAAIARQLAAAEPDFAALQECVGCRDLTARLPARLRLIGDDGAVTILYDAGRWDVADTGVLVLGDDDGWGQREARWAGFVERGSGGRVDVYSTHWCVTIRNADDACDVQRQVAYAEQIRAHLAERRTSHVIVAGDLNVFEGFEDAAALGVLLDAGLVDVFRAAGVEPRATFRGNGWAPAGRVDYVLASRTATVHAAAIGALDPTGAGSDHHPVTAALSFSRRAR